MEPATEIRINADADFPDGDYLVQGSDLGIAVAGSKLDGVAGFGPGYPTYVPPAGATSFASMTPVGTPILDSGTGAWPTPGVYELGPSVRPTTTPATVWGFATDEHSSEAPGGWDRVCLDAPGSSGILVDIEPGAGPIVFAGLEWTADQRTSNLGTLVRIGEDGLVCLVGGAGIEFNATDGTAWVTGDISGCKEMVGLVALDAG